MKITEHLSNAKNPLFSFEIVPPPRGRTLQDLLKIVEILAPLQPPWIDVTSHSPAVKFQELTDGRFEKRSVKKRPGTLGICGVIQNRFRIDTVAHLLCTGFSKEETEDALIELNYLGIHNVLALRGDEPENMTASDRLRIGHRYASDLVLQIKRAAKGQLIDESEACDGLDFCVGVAGYPEKHFEAPSLNFDVEALKRKVDAGADFVVTQMFFDNSKFFSFVSQCRDAGITVPIIPGLKVLRSLNQLNNIPKNFHVDLPDELVEDIQKNPEHASEIGRKWAARQIDQLLSAGFPGVHLYVLNDAETVAGLVRGAAK